MCGSRRAKGTLLWVRSPLAMTPILGPGAWPPSGSSKVGWDCLCSDCLTPLNEAQKSLTFGFPSSVLLAPNPTLSLSQGPGVQ